MAAVTSIPDSSTDPRDTMRERLFAVPLVEELSASEGAAWDAYALGHAGVTVHHLHAWRSIAQRACGVEAPFLVARDRVAGPIRGVLPLFRVARPFAPKSVRPQRGMLPTLPSLSQTVADRPPVPSMRTGYRGDTSDRLEG